MALNYISAAEAASLIKHGYNIGLSGFTPAGTAKAVTAELAKIAEAEGADAVSLINTLLGMSIDINKKKPLLGNIFGGLSGPAVKPVALRMIYQVSNAVSIPILGMGGISNTEDAIEFFLAGASTIAVGTGFFQNPLSAVEIKKGLEEYCRVNRISNISEIVGYAHKDDGVGYRSRIFMG